MARIMVAARVTINPGVAGRKNMMREVESSRDRDGDALGYSLDATYILHRVRGCVGSDSRSIYRSIEPSTANWHPKPPVSYLPASAKDIATASYS